MGKAATMQYTAEIITDPRTNLIEAQQSLNDTVADIIALISSVDIKLARKFKVALDQQNEALQTLGVI